MGIEDAKNPEIIDQSIEHPVADIPKSEKQTAQKEASPEKRMQAEKTVLDTLGIGSDEKLDDFDKKLNEATKSLPRYQQIEKKLEGIERQNLPYELFKALKRDSDEEQIDQNAPKDGVLIQSMKQGPLACAGRTLIASSLLQEHGIGHVPVSAPKHALIIIEQSPDTMAYFDANNNLFFTFPKSALDGYEGLETSAECRLKEYTPRETDFNDGITTAYSHFVAMPAKEAIGRQYLGNVAAALNGNEEFESSGITKDEEASEATHQIETEVYGVNPVLVSFHSRVETLYKKEKARTASYRKVASEVLQTHPTHDDFVSFFTKVLDGNISDGIPFIKNASPERKRVYADNVWDFLQKEIKTKAKEEDKNI